LRYRERAKISTLAAHHIDMNNNGSNVNTILLVVIIVVIIGGGIWWYEKYGPGSASMQPAPAQQGLQVNVGSTPAPAQQ